MFALCIKLLRNEFTQSLPKCLHGKDESRCERRGEKNEWRKKCLTWQPKSFLMNATSLSVLFIRCQQKAKQNKTKQFKTQQQQQKCDFYRLHGFLQLIWISSSGIAGTCEIARKKSVCIMMWVGIIIGEFASTRAFAPFFATKRFSILLKDISLHSTPWKRKPLKSVYLECVI